MYISQNEFFRTNRTIKYELNTKRTPSQLADETTPYEIKNATQCKDMLELILRAFYNNCAISDFVKKDLYDLNKLNEYGRFVIQKLRIHFHDSNEQVCLIKSNGKQYFHKDERYIDFSAVLKHKPNLELHQLLFPEKKCGQYYLAIDDDHGIVYLDKISEW